ncbi:TonB-dependent receptor [Bryobacter aggregatus]|uniref:TonB-dependent receptor n=1 Tax=Bryobacter aggregatus TaxID=360054 RepID=UPI00138DDC3D|nr:carboxypeptidase regulatory-like domain-containing protein [Bryobacter aggregatus]
MRSKFCFAVGFVWAGLWAFAQTQSNTGQIDGRVRDAQGALLVAAQISLRNLDTNFQRELQTDEEGRYLVPFLPIGEYEVTIAAEGFARYRMTGVTLSTGQLVTLEHRLNLVSAHQTITLPGESPMVEVAQSSSSRALTAVDIRNLPNLARNELQFSLLQPFINANRPREYEAPRFDIGGLARRVNFQIDGFENTTSQQKSYRVTRLGPTSVDETQIMTFGANAEYGRTGGGVINNITRSGTNTLHGQFEYLVSRTGFNAVPFRSAGAVKPYADIGAFGVGGALRRDKLFYFVSNETSRRAFPLPLGFTDPAARAQVVSLGFTEKDIDLLPSQFNPTLWLVRLDYQPLDRHTITFRANTYREFNEAQSPGGTTVLSSSAGALTNTYALAAMWNWLITPSLTHEFRTQLADRYSRRTPYLTPNADTLPTTILSGVVSFGYPDHLSANRERIEEFSDNISFHRSTHLLKAGVNLVRSPVMYDDSLNPVFLFAGTSDLTPLEQYLRTIKREIDPSTGRRYSYTQLTLSFGKPRLEYQQTYLGGYVQDSWRLRPNLTLNYGLRYETMYVPSAPANAPHPLSRQIPSDRYNFAPRLGLAWSPRGNPRMAFRLSYGVHFDAPSGNAFRDSLIENSVNEVSVEIAGDSPGSPNYPFYPRVNSGSVRVKPSLSVISPDFQWMTVHQFQVGVVREIAHDLSVTITAAGLHGSKIPVLQNINLDPVSSLPPLADGRTVYGARRLDPNFNNIMELTSAGNSNYHALGIQVLKRFRNALQFNVSYTWSHSLDNAPENGVSGGSEQPQDTYNRRAEYGNSITDVRHVLNASSVARWRGFQLATFLFARSGTTYDVRAGADLNRDSVANDRPLFYGRNVGKGPASMQMDARLSRFLSMERVWPRAKAEVFAESANLFNSPIPDSTNAFLNRTNFTILSWHEMRRVQLGFRFLF